MNRHVRLMLAVGLTVLLGTAAYSQMGGNPPAETSSGADGQCGQGTPPGAESPPGEGGGTGTARKEGKWNISEYMADWERADAEGPEGTWSQTRDIFRPGKGAQRLTNEQMAELARASAQNQVSADRSGESEQLPVLHGIMTGSDDDRVAILGQDMVREGDFCEGFAVRSIKPRSVTLSRDGKEYVLYVKE